MGHRTNRRIGDKNSFGMDPCPASRRVWLLSCGFIFAENPKMILGNVNHLPCFQDEIEVAVPESSVEGYLVEAPRVALKKPPKNWVIDRLDDGAWFAPSSSSERRYAADPWQEDVAGDVIIEILRSRPDGGF